MNRDVMLPECRLPFFPLEHFPARFQAVLWRNWGLVPEEKLCSVLGCDTKPLRDEARRLQLPLDCPVNPQWLTHGYITLIRRNWHLLNYGQLLQLLDWDERRLAFVLKEEDFLGEKLGSAKPECPIVHWRPLSAGEIEATEKIRDLMLRYFPRGAESLVRDVPAFRFFDLPQEKGLPLRGEATNQLRMIHSYVASCGDILDNIEGCDPFPRQLLERYANAGVNGIWFHAVLYLLHPLAGEEKYSSGHERRLRNLQILVDRAAKYGIRLYLYINEPRAFPADFYERHPDWAGVPLRHGGHSNCITRTRAPLQFMEEALHHIFTSVHGLGGVYALTMSENPTHCNFYWDKASCPFCRDVDATDLIADVANAIERGVHSASPSAAVIAADWCWMPTNIGSSAQQDLEFRRKVIGKLHPNICICSVSEHRKEICIAGIKNHLQDYSVSQPGPGPMAPTVWETAREHGLPTMAKIQLNCSWELSALPYLPVPYLVRQHIDNLGGFSFSGLMLSWTLGGWPGGNIAMLYGTPEELARRQFGEQLAPDVCRIWKCASEAFSNYPFEVMTSYVSPIHFGPAALMFDTHPAGYEHATMLGFPYDDLDMWRGPYPRDVYARQFQLVADQWKLAWKMAEALPQENPPAAELTRLLGCAWCHLQSMAHHAAMIIARDAGDDAEMARIAENEIQCAVILHELIRHDPRIGFEASNHYFYTLADLREKILNCHTIMEKRKK